MERELETELRWNETISRKREAVGSEKQMREKTKAISMLMRCSGQHTSSYRANVCLAARPDHEHEAESCDYFSGHLQELSVTYEGKLACGWRLAGHPWRNATHHARLSPVWHGLYHGMSLQVVIIIIIITTYSVLRQGNSLFQSEICRECGLMLPLSRTISPRFLKVIQQ